MGQKYLLCRFGGIGDSVILTPVLKWIHEKLGSEVHFAVPEHQVPLFDNLTFIDKVLPTRRFQSGNEDCVPYKDLGWVTLMAIKDQYDMPIDLKNSVENNTLYPYLVPKVGAWASSQNSNFQNWIDLTFGWCKIDPTKVPDKDKKPLYKLKPEEVRWAKKELPEGLKIGIHCEASSHSRTWYRITALGNKIIEAFPQATVLVWNEGIWHIAKSGVSRPLANPNLRKSIALINECDVIFAADSMISHVAEAIGVPYVAVYSTIPPWTRTMYYEHAHPIEVEMNCHPCFNLHRDCPFNREHALEQLTERERKIFDLQKQNKQPPEVAHELNTTPQLIVNEFRLLAQKLDTVAQREPPCIGKISEEDIIFKLRELIEQCAV